MRAIVYCRVSTERQEEEGTSLQTQEETCLKKARELGYEVEFEYILSEIWSGANLERPKLNKARELIRSRLVDALICFCTDRLSRNPIHIAIVAEECEKHKVNLIFVTEPLDNSIEGALIRYVRGFAAQVEREKIKERTLRGKREGARQGRLTTGGPPPYGYRADGDKRVVYESEAEVVKRIFKWLAYDSYTLYRCANELNALEIPTRKGSKWGNTDIHRIATNPAYVGKTYAFRYQVVEPKHPKEGLRPYTKTTHIRRPKEDWIEVPNVTPPIVDEQTWELAQKQMKINSLRSKRNRKHDYLLVGARLKCAYGHTMIGGVKKRGEKEHLYYRCIHNVNPRRFGKCPQPVIAADKIEKTVKDQITHIITQPDITLGNLRGKEKDKSFAVFEADEVLLQSHLQQVRDEETRYLRLYGRGEINAELLDAEIIRVKRKRGDIEGRLRELEAKRKALREQDLKLENASQFLLNLQEKLNNPELTRLALEALDIRVELGKEQVIYIKGLIPTESNQLTCLTS